LPVLETMKQQIHMPNTNDFMARLHITERRPLKTTSLTGTKRPLGFGVVADFKRFVFS
jgi:hypothetical protein